MKTLIALTLCCLSLMTSLAWAGVTPLFRRDGRKATMFVSGRPGDADAQNLFAAMTAPEQIIDNKRTKRMNFETGGTRVFSLVCVLSNLVNENGSCTLILNEGPGTKIDRAQSYAQFLSENPQDLNRLMAAFNAPVAQKVFSSGDGSLHITLRISEGRPTLFEILYQ